MARSGLAEVEVVAMMLAQSSRAERLAIADDVIDNSGSLADLQRQVAALHPCYLKMASIQDASGQDMSKNRR